MQKIVVAVVLLAVGGAIALAIVPALPDEVQDWISDAQTSLEERSEDVKEAFSASDASNESSDSDEPLATTLATKEFEGQIVGGVPLDELTASDIFEMERLGKITKDEAATALTVMKGLTIDEIPATIDSPNLTRITPTKVSQSEVDGYREFMLELINEDRLIAGLTELTLGTNPAAQAHAEEMLEYSFLSHWGLDGYKPYMRYVLAGGVGGDAENASGIESEMLESVRYRKITSVESELREAQQGFMRSPGHRKNILDPWHQKVNLGIACDDVTCAVVQQFESQYVEYEEFPNIDSGVLTVSGRILAPFKFEQIDVWYERPPAPLSLGQVDVTYCYSIGDIPVAFVSPPLAPGSFYPEDNSTYDWESCKDPYLADPNAPRKKSLPVGVIRLPSLNSEPVRKVPTPWVVANQWDVEGDSFRIEVDLTDALTENGPGVYTVLIWGESSGEMVSLTNYPVFVD
ncbi:MAG: CAP domain-containing protein [Chloroflexi bacterium]|nr:CAP domain-containing protein [Chloroflexota bacterium]MDA1272121.1 CAP domain-containing protein [Chloroflexota bacterium]PKB58563.1 MAG: hypothetical protein BZY83_06335 [SAR202 cluster bacterium Casp-Chloro-G2]